MIKSVHYLQAGSCTHPEYIVNPKSKSLKNITFPSLVVLIEHSKHGLILFDTGYTEDFYKFTKYFPEKFYALITPVKISNEDSAKSQLLKLGIKPEDIQYIICSHFHADHISGLRDFPKAKIIASMSEFEYLNNRSKMGQIKSGFLKNLIPDDFKSRIIPFQKEFQFIPELHNLFEGFDVFHDQSIFIVLLKGHSMEHVGLFFKDHRGENIFLVSDSVWTLESFQKNILPSKITRLIHYDFKEYAKNIHNLNSLFHINSNIKIIPCHCNGEIHHV